MLNNDSKTAQTLRSKIVVTTQQKKQIADAYNASLTVTSMLKFLQVGLDSESHTYTKSLDADGWFMIEAIIEKSMNVMYTLDEIQTAIEMNNDNEVNPQEALNQLRKENQKLRALLTVSNAEYKIISAIGATFNNEGGAK